MDESVIWLIRGSQRKILFLNISEDPFLSNKLRKGLNEKCNLNLSLREVSRHLKDFEKRELVKCRNPRDPYNHIYEITSKGKKIQKEIIRIHL